MCWLKSKTIESFLNAHKQKTNILQYLFNKQFIWSTCPKKLKWGPEFMESDEDDRRSVKHRQSRDFSRLEPRLEDGQTMSEHGI